MKSTQLFSVSELFERVAPYVPPLLVPKDNLDRILEFAALLPQSMPIGVFGFESVMKTSRYRADMSLCVDLLEIDKDGLREWFNSDAWSLCLQQDTAWQDLARLMKKGVDEAFFTSGVFSVIWLEFDIGTRDLWPPRPNFFIKCDINTPAKALIANLGFLENQKLVSRIETMVNIAATYQLRPLHIGWMLGRRVDWMKLVFTPLSLEVCERFLREISYLYPVEPLLSLLGKISPVAARMVLQLDLNEEGLGPKIGIECFDLDFSRLLQVLVAENLMREEEAAALFSWCGGKRYTYREEQHEFSRVLNHVKIVYHPEQPFQTKAYVAGIWLKEERKIC